MKKSKMHQTKVVTNLEKKTRQKISKMTTSSGSCTADLLKDLKLLSKFKKCHVRVARLSKNTLGKIGKKKEKPQRKVKATLVRGVGITKKPERRGRPRKFSATQLLQIKPESTHAKSEYQVPQIEGRKRKAIKSPDNSKRNKEEKKKRQIFIRLPFLETAKLKSLNKDLIEKNYNKKAHPIKRLGKTYLTEKFGTRFFRCHVKVARYRSPNHPTPKKKDKFSRKNVSFVETVEVFGESDDDLSHPMNSPRTSTPAHETCSSNDNITVSPSRRKVSLLKNTESSRSEHMRRSDEKVPRVKSVNTTSSVTEIDTDNADLEAEVEQPNTVLGVEGSTKYETLNVNEPEREVLSEDERMDEEKEEEEKDHKTDQMNEKKKDKDKEELSQVTVVSTDETTHVLTDDVETHDENSHEMCDDNKGSIQEGDSQSGKQPTDQDVETFEMAIVNNVEQKCSSHQRSEDDREASNLSAEQSRSAGNNNNSNHVELSSISDHDGNMLHDIVQNEFEMNPEPELFPDGDDQEKEFSLQISNNSEMSALCQKAEQNDPESDSILSNLNNIDSILDDTSDRPQAQQTKFSLNTFFKSLKTKIISQRTESIPPTKAGNQCTEREGDQTLRDELTIK